LVGLVCKNFWVITSIFTGEAEINVSFIVPVTTTCSSDCVDAFSTTATSQILPFSTVIFSVYFSNPITETCNSCSPAGTLLITKLPAASETPPSLVCLMPIVAKGTADEPSLTFPFTVPTCEKA